jgi:hypothetical protein
MLPQQQAVSTRTPTHTPTPTPPPSIVSPPPQNPGLVRKSSLTAESSTIHHMAQTTHQANVSSIVQGEFIYFVHFLSYSIHFTKFPKLSG